MAQKMYFRSAIMGIFFGQRGCPIALHSNRLSSFLRNCVHIREVAFCEREKLLVNILMVVAAKIYGHIREVDLC